MRIAREKLQLLTLLGLAAILFFANTWAYDLWPADEPRFAQAAREMMQSGDYLSPQVNGLPYKEKPPLLLWLIALVSQPFGDVTEFSARAVSGAAALLTIWLTWRLASRLYGPRGGFWSGLVLATTMLFWWEARSVRTDMVLTAALTAALYAFWRRHETRRPAWAVAFYAAVAAGLYAKGPPALVFPALLIAAFYWRRRGPRRAMHWALGFAAAIALVLVWFIPARLALHESGPEGAAVGAEAYRQIIGRLFLGMSKAQPPWYYLVNLPAALFPWTVFLPWTLPWVWRRRREDDRMRLLLAWTVPAFVFFTISTGKRDVYLLPLYPAFAILIARSVLDLMDSERVRWRMWTARVWAAALLLLAVGAVAALFTPYCTSMAAALVALAVFSLCAATVTLVRAFATRANTLHTQVAGHFAVLALFSALALFPAIDAYKGAGAICAPLRRLSNAGTEYKLYTIGFSREEYIYYARHFHQPVLTDLLPMDLNESIDPVVLARQQRTLRKAIAEAASAVPVASLAAPTPEEVEALRAAAHGAVLAAKVDPGLAPAFETALRQTLAAFDADFDGSEPAFVFVQEDDWKWIIPFLPRLAHYRVLARQPVGRRDMLLVANPAGAERAVSGVPLKTGP